MPFVVMKTSVSKFDFSNFIIIRMIFMLDSCDISSSLSQKRYRVALDKQYYPSKEHNSAKQ